MNALKKTAQVALVALVVLVVTVLHYGGGHRTLGAHISHRELYFIPILLASFWFGLKYGLATALAISLIYAPQVYSRGEPPGNLWPVVFQVAVFILVAVMVGTLVERVKREQRRMFRVEKSAALGRAATAVGHEMRDLLEALKSIAGRAERPASPELRRDFEKELARLERMVGILSSFKTAGPPQLFSNDLNAIIRERLEGHRAAAEKKGVGFTTDLDPLGCPSRVNTETIGWVLDQIILNALEVSARGQTIRVVSTRGGDHCRVTVADEGPGIRPEHLASVFKPFFTTKENGDGLALSASRKALHDMGGDIRVESEFGKGAAFTVVVPREYSGRPLEIDPVETVLRGEKVKRLYRD